ncbi:unnamed protein product, partial [Coccothraustes coccothraustes]
TGAASCNWCHGHQGATQPLPGLTARPGTHRQLLSMACTGQGWLGQRQSSAALGAAGTVQSPKSLHGCAGDQSWSREMQGCCGMGRAFNSSTHLSSLMIPAPCWALFHTGAEQMLMGQEPCGAGRDLQLARCSALPQVLSERSNPSWAPQGT